MAGKKKNRQNQPRLARQLPIAERISWLITVATTLALPLVVVVSGKDMFRLPKQLLMEASAIAVATVTVCGVIVGALNSRQTRWSRPLLFIVSSALTWSAVATIASTNCTLSIFSLLYAASATMLFMAVYNAAQTRSFSLLYIPLAPALANAVIAIAQRITAWTPIATDATTSRTRTAALLGNPNDVGMFLLAPTLAAIALGISSKKHRPAAMIIAAVLAGGLLASETVGAIAALWASLFVLLLFVTRPRVAIIAGLATVLIATAFVRLSPLHWEQTRSKIHAAVHGDIDIFLSGRVPAFRAASRMFQKNPFVGVGLGCFAFHYFDEKIALTRAGGGPVQRFYLDPNFGEVHNEHLQILAEAGLPGYAIFLAALMSLARISLRRAPPNSAMRMMFARCLALPLAVGIFVLTLSSFPLRLASSTENILFICAVTMAWSEDERG